MIWILALLFSPLLAQETERAFSLPLFTEGLHTRYSANAIPDPALAQAVNVLIDEDVNGIVVARRGYAKYNSTALTNTKTVRGLWNFDASDGTKYLIALTSASFYRSPGNGSWTAISGLDQFSLTNEWDCVQALGKLWCANGQTVFNYDGTSTNTVSTAPTGTLIDRFRNRLVISGISGQKGRIRLSGELDGTDWTTANLSTSAVNIAVGGVDDGQDVTCLMGVYQDVLIIGKRDSLWGLYGFDRRDFSLREISREVGCLEDRSVQEKNNCLYWLSKRGVEKFCGTSIERISDPIRDQIDTIIATAGNARSAIDTSQSDFELGQTSVAGPGSSVSTVISPGNVVPSSWSVTETLGSEFSSGVTFNTNLTTQSISDSVSIASSAYVIRNGDFELGDFTDWTCIGGSGCGCSVSAAAAVSGSYGATLYATCGVGQPTNASVFIYDAVDGTTVATRGSNEDTGTFTLDLSASSSRSLRAHYRTNSGATTCDLVSSTFTAISSFTWTADSSGCGDAGYGWEKLDDIKTNRYFSAYQASATYSLQSRVFDSTISTTVGGPFTASSSTPNGTSLAYQVRSASSAFGAWTAWGNQTNLGRITETKRYYQYISSFTTTSSTATPRLDDVTLQAATSGYFISQCRNPGTSITRWGNFQCGTVLNSGDLTLAIATGTTCNAVTRSTANWNTQVNNSPISIATAPFVAYRVLFDIDAGTEVPTIQDCTINWIEGETRPPVASAVYRDRYYLAYTSSTASGAMNDHQVVLDKNDKWTLFDNHFCYSLSLYNRKLYCGASTNSGQVWQMDIGTDDDGASYSSIIKTKAYNFGIPEARKKYSRLYLDLEPEPNDSDSINVTGRYYVDRGTTSYSFGTVDLGEDPGYLLTPKLPFPMSDTTSSRYLQIELQTSGQNQPWRLYGGRLYFRVLSAE